jgi:hypothetical protein
MFYVVLYSLSTKLKRITWRQVFSNAFAGGFDADGDLTDPKITAIGCGTNVGFGSAGATHRSLTGNPQGRINVVDCR